QGSPSLHQALIEHWDGTQWSVVPGPNITTDYVELDGISAVSANDAWTVGYYTTGNTQHTLVVHWDGTQWSVVPSPNPDSNYNALHSVAAMATNDVGAVGHSDYGGANSRTL